ncbi:MAG: hypothetical protein ACK4YF_09675 [Exilispira sp.]
MKCIKIVILILVIFSFFLINIFTIKIYAQQKFSLIFTYNFDEYNNDIFWSDPDYKGNYFLTHFSILFNNYHNFIFLSLNITLKFYLPLFDSSLNLYWINPSISFLLGVYTPNYKNIIAKAGFFITFSYLNIQTSGSIIYEKYLIKEGLSFSFGIKLTEKINLVLDISFQTDLTSFFGDYFVFLDSIITGIGLEF